jgi:nucleoside-diphosphate-sugar epimerase
VNKLPSILITGASGFVGSHLIEMMIENFTVYAIARRSIKESNISYHRNLHWIQCDITNKSRLNDAIDYIQSQGGIDYIFHLAAYYDFTYKYNSAYQSVNIDGTKNMLELASRLNIKRFIFASSIAACKFPKTSEAVTEKSSPDADYHYARSKKAGEELLMQYSKFFPCSVVRFAAVFSDWCEYAPLYKFLMRWLSKNFDSRIIAGKGISAIPYVHIRDLCLLFCKIIDKHKELPDYDVYNCSPNLSTSHNSIYELSTGYFFGKSKKPIYLPELLALPALILNRCFNVFRISTSETFEKLWMINYIDKILNVDSSYTQRVLDWKPTSRYNISRRLLFILEKMKSHPGEWHLRNEAALKRIAKRANFIIYEKMSEQKDTILFKINKYILDEDPDLKFNQYKQIPLVDFKTYSCTIYHLILATIRSSDRSLFLEYIDKITHQRWSEGFSPETLCETLKVFDEVIVKQLTSYKEFAKFHQEIYDYVSLTFQIAEDEIEDLYDSFAPKLRDNQIAKVNMLGCTEIPRLIHQLSGVYQALPEEDNKSEVYLINNLR